MFHHRHRTVALKTAQTTNVAVEACVNCREFKFKVPYVCALCDELSAACLSVRVRCVCVCVFVFVRFVCVCALCRAVDES